MRKKFTYTFAALAACSSVASAATLVGGATSVALDTEVLASAASLEFSSVSSGIGAGVLPGSVAFPINPTNAAVLPTTFNYTAGDFPGGPFSGSIGHTGSVFFNDDTVEVGSFTISFDAARVTEDTSGFFVSSNAGIAAPLFDTRVVALGEASNTGFDVTVDLLVSPEFAGFLQENSLATSDLTGADVGDARIVGSTIPEPSTLLGLGMAGLFAFVRRR